MSGGWRDHAACLGEDPDLFFPEGDDPRSDAEAKAICAGCQVRTPCLEFAGTHLAKGTWGGLTEDEREAARRRQLRNARERAGRAAA
jgi:WhiB family redox-sensing transcriptional regulator